MAMIAGTICCVLARRISFKGAIRMTNPVNVKMLDLPAEYHARKAEYDAALAEVFESGMYVLGGPVRAFESELASYIGVEHAVTCGNGTDALILTLRALGVGPGDEVITTPFTFFATTEVIFNVGAKPVFVDIDPVTFNLNPSGVSAAQTPRTKAVLSVGLYGQVPDIEAIRQVVNPHGVYVLEDAAQSFGATRHGVRSGAVSKLAATSFFPTKPLGCFGDGGACFTDDADLAQRLKMLRHHGDAGRYDHRMLGWNSRLDTLQAAVLRVKLRHFEEDLAARRRVADAYTSRLADVDGVTVPRLADGNTSAWAQYAVRVSRRDVVLETMRNAGVPAAVHYPMAVYHQPALRELGFGDQHCPQAERAADEVLCLPIHPLLTEPQIDRVVEVLTQAVGVLPTGAGRP